MRKPADIATADTTGDNGRRTSPAHDEIAQLAFGLYESRGRQDGHDIEDWLRAEQELVQHYRNGDVPTNRHDALNDVAQTKG